MPLSDKEVMVVLQQAMASVGMSLTRTEPSPFERALAHQVERLVASKTGDLPASSSTHWWTAGPVISRDDRHITVHLEGDFQTLEEHRRYLSSLCEVLNRSDAALG